MGKFELDGKDPTYLTNYQTIKLKEYCSVARIGCIAYTTLRNFALSSTSPAQRDDPPYIQLMLELVGERNRFALRRSHELQHNGLNCGRGLRPDGRKTIVLTSSMAAV